MQDAISSIVNRYDLAGRYLDINALNELEIYFSTGLERIRISEIINSQASNIIKEASAQLYDEQPELLRPGGNSYTTRRYAACLRDIEYYLRYCSYAIVAGDNNIIDERVLDGLRETYNSLEVPIGPTIRSIQILQDIIIETVKINQIEITGSTIIDTPFQYLIKGLSEKNI
uniref:Allophycocyanin beta 18 subunit n=1 Tax=Helminthora furcellata TaxID=1884666 RepID=A0A1G4NR17_9FLOR|nr:Allophycocyanin beta 18 subunit [Helminthora furcellata]SCW21107.1 Allophycocyanin beta 18 subunit [Helminthora furcellata]SCW23967.1 Allophycocyanin beta 18 subunit [Helminthora furcellata]